MYIHPAKLNQTKSQAGFTLIETLVALVILTMALIPILTVSSSTTRISAVIKDDLVAAGLAQEGVEVVQAMRDTNWFNSRAFNSSIGTDVVGEENSYRVQWDSATPLALNGNPPLKLSNGIYNYTTGTDTKFSRKIKIQKVNAGEIRVISEVGWATQSNSTKTVTAEVHLFNWR